MTPVEAAIIIGVTPTTVRAAIRSKTLPARKIKSDNNQFGYVYSITPKAALLYRRFHTNKGGRFNVALIALRMKINGETRKEAETWIAKVSNVRRHQWYKDNNKLKSRKGK